jgi:hypothetical protein
MSKADEIPLTKLPKAELADKWGALKARLKKIDAEIDLLKEEFERRRLTVVEGAKFSVVRSTRSFEALDIKGVRAEMGPAWCAEHSSPSNRVTYEVRALSAEERAAK